MTKLLYIQASPRHGSSRSIAVADAYLAGLKEKTPDLEVDTSGAFSQAFLSPAFGVDHQSTYMDSWLDQAGVTDRQAIRYQPTILDRRQ